MTVEFDRPYYDGKVRVKPEGVVAVEDSGAGGFRLVWASGARVAVIGKRSEIERKLGWGS
jgi:hypothetical protein